MSAAVVFWACWLTLGVVVVGWAVQQDPEWSQGQNLLASGLALCFVALVAPLIMLHNAAVIIERGGR